MKVGLDQLPFPGAIPKTYYKFTIRTTTSQMSQDAQEQPIPHPQEAALEEKPEETDYEEKYKRALADYVNLERRAATDIQNGIDRAIDGMMREFLDIHDDFVRARDAYRDGGAETAGLDSVIKNVEALFHRHQVVPIKAAGSMFDPRLHEAMATKDDPELEEQTITKELRKGYITNNRVLRPALVEVSTKGGHHD